MSVTRFLVFLATLPLAAAAPPAAFTAHAIASDLRGGYQVVVADLNHDGRPDLIAVASGMPELVWYENPGWQRHVLATGVNRMINCVVVGNEIVLASEFNNEAKNSRGIVSVLRPGADVTQAWTVTEIDRIPTSHRLRLAHLGGGRTIVVNAALTAATASGPDFRGATPLVYYVPGEWKRHEIGTIEGLVHGIFVTDWNRDGRDDLLMAGFSGILLFSPKKDGTWSRTEIAKGDPAPWPKSGASDITVGHLGKRRFLATIEPWHGNEVAVYTERGKQWERKVIDTSLTDGHTVQTADFNRDGNDEIVAGFRGAPHSVYLYNWSGADWTRGVLDEGGMGAAACAVADLNGDGREDIACIDGTRLKWYENAAR
ncbi:MAG: VCBS repeat-containing protein [Acidobacteria bacterium]|nr:VCBS repeat-containing protein [Acidobacteriota bacterium]